MHMQVRLITIVIAVVLLFRPENLVENLRRHRLKNASLLAVTVVSQVAHNLNTGSGIMLCSVLKNIFILVAIHTWNVMY